jgi:hypothetical protein
MSQNEPIREGQILTGALFSEPMRVETVKSKAPDSWRLGLVGKRNRPATAKAESSRKAKSEAEE